MTESTIATVCSAISAATALGSVCLAYKAIWCMEVDSDANVLMRIIELVQCEEARKSRKIIFEQDDYCKDLDAMHAKELEDVCWRYDVLGMLADTVRLRNKVILAWGPSVLSAWGKVEQTVVVLRANRGNSTLWKRFEDLAKDSKNRKSGGA